MKAYCHNCEKDTEYTTITRNENERGYWYQKKIPYCNKCLQRMFVRRVEEVNFNSLAEAVRAKKIMNIEYVGVVK